MTKDQSEWICTWIAVTGIAVIFMAICVVIASTWPPPPKRVEFEKKDGSKVECAVMKPFNSLDCDWGHPLP